jgi:hypothetical protein
MEKKNRSCLSRILAAMAVLLGLCLFLALVSVISNRNLPGEEGFDTLSPIEKVRLLETLHLRSTLGDRLWQGWGSADIPIIIFNQSHEFLTNYDGTVPAGWSPITGDDLNGRKYYRRAADEPQNFAVPVGEGWAASMATKQTTDHFLIETFQEKLPAPINQIFPYRLLIQPSETQMGGVLHESFHVFQYQNAPERMAEAESIHKLGKEYETSTEAFQSEWKQESNLLADALEAKTDTEKIELARQFLAARDNRRIKASLDARLVKYERWLEWEEGTAKYTEVKMLRLAGASTNYAALPQIKIDPDFKGYQKVDQRWSDELFQLRHPLSTGEPRLYMTGLAQAFLLDELMPGWKDEYWKQDIFLEDLLRQAIQGKLSLPL